MPATTLPPVLHWTPAPLTKENLEWADLPIIDLSKASTPEGRAELAPHVRDVMRTTGFMYVVNHGLTPAQTERVFDIGDTVFTQVPEDEKKRCACKLQEEGSKLGYKLRQLWTIHNGVRDQNEQFCHNPFADHPYPKTLEPFLPELEAFAYQNHCNVLYTILRLLARGMELPEETFVNMHRFDASCGVGSHLRFIKYYPRSEEEETKSEGIWVKGHTDVGTITILYSQPVSALQILPPDRKWRWVKHIDNALVINIGEAMEMLSGGFYKATIHRVIQPPEDQRSYTRLGAYYFALANEDVRLVPLMESPALQRAGVVRQCEDDVAPTMGEWRVGRNKSFGFREMQKMKEDGKVEEMEILNGIAYKQYN